MTTSNDLRPAGASAEPAPAVSVVIPSYNARATIERCLASVLAQELEGGFEVWLVDSSDDGTGELVEERFPGVNLVRFPERTLPGPARNEGIRRARGEILAFTDSDCVVPAGWLAAHVARHRERDEPNGEAGASPRRAAVGGAVTNGLANNAVAWSGLLVEFNEFLPSSPERRTELLPTCNVSYRREVFEEHGTFPVDLWPSEDHIFSWRLAQAGEELFFDPAIVIEHLFRPTFSAFVRHQRRLGAASAKARKQVDLPNAWLVTSPLRFLTPLMRLARMELRLVRSDLANFLRFNAFLPVCVTGLVAWGIGFSTGRAGGAE